MSIAVQKGFWQDRVLADTRQKLAQLYFKSPRIAESEKRVILEYWQAYEGLAEVLKIKTRKGKHRKIHLEIADEEFPNEE